MITVLVNRTKSKIKTELKNNQPIIIINLSVEGNVAEVNTKIALSNEKEIIKLQDELAKAIEREMYKSIDIAQKYKTDIFSFGDQFRISHPKYWKRVQNDWNDEIFPNAEIKLNVKAFIRQTNLQTELMYITKSERCNDGKGKNRSNSTLCSHSNFSYERQLNKPSSKWCTFRHLVFSHI